MMTRLRAAFLLAALCILSGGAHAAPAKTHPFGWPDMFAMVRLSDPQPSPDGRWVLYTRATYDVEANKGNLDLGLVSMDGRTERRLTNSPAVDTNGRWLPDGSAILFLSTRSGSAQVWRMSMQGGDPVQVTRLPVDVDGFELSPDGHRLLFWTGVHVDAKDLAGTAARVKEREDSKVKAQVFDRLFIRHWDTWNDGRRNHLFVMPVAGGEPVDLTRGMDQDAPTKPFGGSDEVAWSPDGSTIAFVSKPAKNEAMTTNNEIYLVPASGATTPRCVTSENPAVDTAPAFSPDGRTLAYLAMERAGFEADRQHVVLMDVASGRKTHLTQKWDRSVSQVVWARDGRSLYAIAADTARNRVFRIDVPSGQVKMLVADGYCGGLTLTRQGLLVFSRERLTQPAEVFTFEPGSSRLTQVSHLNDERLRQVRMSQPEEFWFTHDGFRIHGWMLKPVDFDPTRKYPLAFLIHGGPQGDWGDDFHYRWNPQFYAGAGYVVLAIDPRGSTSYGQAFTDAIRGNWGPGPCADLMAGLKAALEKYPFIDSKRMAALGASYGGYMINWIEGQDNPFQCLVSHDGDFNLESAYYNTEELWFPEWEMKGVPYENPETYRRHSPSQFIAKWKTPMLVIQGGQDFRVVETEAFSTFTALQRRGVPSRFLYFPDENHWVRKPQNSRLWHATVLEWLDRWTATTRK